MKYWFSFSLLLCLLSLGLAASAEEGRVSRILRTIDEQYRLKTDAAATVLVTQQKVDQGTKVIGMQYCRRDADHSFIIIMTAPESDRGNGYLRVADNFWMYRQNTRTFQHISRDESIGGTDAHGEDFEDRKMTELYQPQTGADGKEIYAEEKLGQIPVIKFEVKAKVNDVDYPRKIYWVRQDNNLILKEEAYALSGTLMQTAYYLKFTQIDGRYVAVKMFFLDEFEKGNKTLVEISDIKTDKLSDALFTKAYLENLSK